MSVDIAEWVRRSCETQGIPIKVTNPATIRNVAILLSSPRNHPAPRKAPPMVAKTFITLICDSCGKESADRDAVDTHTLALDGTAGETDLCARCLEKIVRVVNPVLNEARRIKIPASAWRAS